MKTKFLAALSVPALSGLIFFISCSKDSSPIGPDNNLPKVELGIPVKIAERGSEPDWSPDGKWLAYGCTYIFVIPDTGGTAVQITNDYNYEQGQWNNYPSWSPDGTIIAFNSNQGEAGNFKVFIVPASGGASTQLTPDSIFVAGCDWSPDGTQIVFSAQTGHFPEVNLWTVRLSNGQLTHLTSESNNGWPKFSPDGSRIAFESGSPLQVWTVAADGSDRQQITQNGGEFPCWSPDGKWIAFTSNRSGNYDIYVVSADGGEEIQITTSPNHEVRPAWSLDGKKIAFDTNLYPSEPGVWAVTVTISE